MQQAQDVGVGAFLDALLSADNDVRNRAEAARDAALRSEAGARQLVAQLAGSALSDPSPARRSTAAVVLRRTVQRDGRVWELLDAATQGGLKATLLRAFLAEAAPDVQRKVAHAIAELACVAAVAPLCAFSMTRGRPAPAMSEYQSGGSSSAPHPSSFTPSKPAAASRRTSPS